MHLKENILKFNLYFFLFYEPVTISHSLFGQTLPVLFNWHTEVKSMLVSFKTNLI